MNFILLVIERLFKMKKIAIIVAAMVMSLVACDPKVSVSDNSGGSGNSAGMAGMAGANASASSSGSSGAAGMALESTVENAGAAGAMPMPSASASASH